MKAVIFEETGEPADILHIRDIPDPAPGPGDILVRVSLSAVHPADLHVMRGRFGRTPALPTSPGIECVGIVEALGAGVDGPKPRTRVVWLSIAFARRVARPDRRRIRRRPSGAAACAKRGVSHAQPGAAVRAGRRDRGIGRRPDLVHGRCGLADAVCGLLGAADLRRNPTPGFSPG